jgi:hypothetical protein
MIAANFQPWHALLGGASLGILSAGKTLITSRVLGISGTVKYVDPPLRLKTVGQHAAQI